MSRATIILIAILVLIVAGLVWLSRGPNAVAPHHIEKTVTLNGAQG
jgi:hypothetical protein